MKKVQYARNVIVRLPPQSV